MRQTAHQNPCHETEWTEYSHHPETSHGEKCSKFLESGFSSERITHSFNALIFIFKATSLKYNLLFLKLAH